MRSTHHLYESELLECSSEISEWCRCRFDVHIWNCIWFGHLTFVMQHHEFSLFSIVPTFKRINFLQQTPVLLPLWLGLSCISLVICIPPSFSTGFIGVMCNFISSSVSKVSLGCQHLPAMGVVSIQDLAACGGSSYMSSGTQPPHRDSVNNCIGKIKV